MEVRCQQDGRLAPVYFLPEYKYFDQPLQTVKNEITVYNLVFEGFLRKSMPPLISVFYAKEEISRLSFKDFFVLQYQKILLKQFGVKGNFGYRKKNLDRGLSRFSDGEFLSHSTEKFRRRTLLCFKKFLVSKSFTHKRGASRCYRKFFVSQDRKTS